MNEPKPTNLPSGANAESEAVRSSDLLGTFAPTCYYDSEKEAVVVVLEIKQMIAVTMNASNPADDSHEARWGRSVLQELSKIYWAQCQKTGPCEVRLVRRRYDSEHV